MNKITAVLPRMGFYSINCTDYLHSSPIITGTSDTDQIISVHYRGGDCTLSMFLAVLLRRLLFILLLLIIILAAAMLVNLRVTPCCASGRMRRRRRATPRMSQRMAHHDNPKQQSLSCFEHTEARTLHLPPSICSVHEFTSGGHQAGFTTGQQKHVIHRRTPYLGAYVRENQVHVPLISIIHHKLCKGAIGRAKAYEPQIKHAGLCCSTCNTIKGDSI